MQRINSVNARPNVNGTGKIGFSDNADLAGQDATYMTPEWCNYIQEEISQAIEGFGVELMPNKYNQLYGVLKKISDRIKTLEERIIEEIKVGDLFITTINFTSSDQVKSHKGYGTWQRYGNGHALVALGDTTTPLHMQSIADRGGEYLHRLTVDEVPALLFRDWYYPEELQSIDQPTSKESMNGFNLNYGSSGTDHDDTHVLYKDKKTIEGGGGSHNNIQPSITVGVWIRVPDDITYTLTSDKATVAEGGVVTWSLTTNMPTNCNIGYTIIVKQGDIIESMISGVFFGNDREVVFAVPANNDMLNRTAVLSINNVEVSNSVQISNITVQ